MKATLVATATPFGRDSSGTTAWSVSHETQRRAHRFLLGQRQSIIAPADTPALHIVRLLFLDGVLPSALDDIENQKSMPYLGPEGVAIEWSSSSPPRLERRLLSPLTALAWPKSADRQPDTDQPQNTASPAAAFTSTAKVALAAWLHSQGLYASLDNPVDELEQDMLCWLNDFLPASLYAHCSGLSVLSAIPRTALGRLQTKQALDPHLTTPDAPAAEEIHTSSLINMAYVANGDKMSPTVLAQILDVFSTKPATEVDGLIKRFWAQELSNLRGRLAGQSPKLAILCAWSADMCEGGTVQAKNPAASTVKAYVQVSIRALAAAMEKWPDDPDDWQTSDLLVSYQNIYKSTKTGSQSQMGAALASFHQFLTEWFDVEPLETPIGNGKPVIQPVNANIVWDHEIDLCIDYAGSAALGREGQIVRVMFSVARHQGVRIQDLQRLRICNLSFDQDERGTFCEIEIVRDASRGRLKTESSQRRILIRDPGSLGIIHQWLDQRQSEGAPRTALLFGEISDDKQLYRPGAVHGLANRMLKAVTGDPSIRFHHLRHTSISQQITQCWLSQPIIDVNPIELVAASSGHANPTTTLRVYANQYELALRFWLTYATHSNELLLSKDWAAVLQLKPNTLVTKAGRLKMPAPIFCINELQRVADTISFESVSDGVDWVMAENVCARREQKSAVVPTTIAEALSHLSEGGSHARAAAMLQMADTELTSWLDRLNDSVDELIRIAFPRRAVSNPESLCLHLGSTHLFRKLDALGISFVHARQQKYTDLAEYLQNPVPRPELTAAIQSWSRCIKDQYIALDAPGHARGLLRMLKAAGVSGAMLRPMVEVAPFSQTGATAATHHPIHLTAIRSLFEQEMEIPPVPQTTTPRDGRPCAYLLWTSSPTEEKTSSAAGSISGFKAWLLSIQGYLLLLESPDTRD